MDDDVAPRNRFSRFSPAEVAALDAAEGLPEALIHPDFVLANVVATPGGCGAAWLPRARHAGSGGTRPPGGGRPDPPPDPARLVGVHGTDNPDAGHDRHLADEGPDRDDRDPGPSGGDGPLTFPAAGAVTQQVP